MSYVPTNWQNGDVITIEKMNKIEEGIVAVSDNKNYPGWDIVIKIEVSGSITSNEKIINNYEILKGYFLSIKNKIASGHIVAALLYEKYNQEFGEDVTIYNNMVSSSISFEDNSLESPIFLWGHNFTYKWTIEGLSFE